MNFEFFFTSSFRNKMNTISMDIVRRRKSEGFFFFLQQQQQQQQTVRLQQQQQTSGPLKKSPYSSPLIFKRSLQQQTS